MQELIVGVSRSKKKFAIASWAIRAYQCTKFSHIYLKRFTRVFTTPIIIHASEGLVQRMSGPQFDKKHFPIREFKITVSDEKYVELRDMMHFYSGDNYSIIQNVGILWVDLVRAITGKRVSNPWQKGWNCSEFVMSILIQVFPEKFKDFDPNTVTPKEIYNILLELVEEGLVEAL